MRLSRIFCGSASIKRVNTSSGLDAATLALVLETIENYIADAIPGERLLALDQTDECPADVIRGLWGEPVGGRLLFLPEEYGGMGGSAVDVYRVCARLAGIVGSLSVPLHFLVFCGRPRSRAANATS